MAYGYIYKIKLKKGSVELVFSAVFLAANYLGVLRTTVSNALNGYQKPFVKGWEVSHR